MILKTIHSIKNIGIYNDLLKKNIIGYQKKDNLELFNNPYSIFKNMNMNFLFSTNYTKKPIKPAKIQPKPTIS
jgi:hypothetical protein